MVSEKCGRWTPLAEAVVEKTMSKILLGCAGKRPVHIDLKTLLTTRGLVQASSGGGKSRTLRRLAEQLFGKVQTFIIDKEGEFPSLREKFGYVLVGKGGETPTDTRSAELVCHKLLQHGASAVFDLYDLKDPDRHRWVRLFLHALMNAPKSLWRPLVVIVDEAHRFCMDSATDILTQKGWRKWDEVHAGDLIVAYDLTKETCLEEAVQRVIMRPYEGEMVVLQSDGIDALVTPDHRVVYKTTQRGMGRYGKMYGPFLRAASELPQYIQIPISPGLSGKGIADLTLEHCHLLGWIITDGNFTGGNRKKYISIEQSVATVKGSESTVAVLDRLTDKCNALSVYDRQPRITTSKTGRAIRHSQTRTYYLGQKLSEELLRWLGSDIHRIPRRLLIEGSRKQLEALLQGLLEGDGTRSKRQDHGWKGWITFYPGNSEALADDFLELCARFGISASKAWVPSIRQWHIHLSRRRFHYVRKTERKFYSGMTWDVTVPSGAFVARRHGRVFVTGNCPERGQGESEAYGAMIDLATDGRKRGFAAVYATQRLGKLSKNASAELLNRFVGRTIEDIDVDRAADLLSVRRADRVDFEHCLKTLKPGHFWSFGQAVSTERVLVYVGPVVTTHPEPGSPAAAALPPTPQKVKALLPKLADLPKQAEEKAKTEAELRAEICTLKAQVVAQGRERATAATPRPETKRIEIPVVSDGQIRRLEQALKRADEISARALQAIGKLTLEDSAKTIRAAITEARSLGAGRPASTGPSRALTPAPRPPMKAAARPIPVAPGNGNGQDLIAGERRMIEILAQFYPGTRTRSQLGALAGYTPSGGTFGNYFGRLKRLGYIRENADGSVSLSVEGLDLFGGHPPTGPRTSRELIDMWRSKLLSGERKMLDVLVETYPDPMTREELGEHTGFTATGGTFGNYLGTLRRNALVIVEGENVKAADTLFELQKV
jgi:hypothetical protein